MSESEVFEDYLGLIVAAIPPRGQVSEDVLPAIQQYLRCAQQEGEDPKALYAEVQALKDNAPEYSQVQP
jgi:hypothetical protein